MREERPLTPGTNIPSLTGIRLFAAMGVLLFHFSEIDADKGLYFDWGIFNRLFQHGAIGVDVFFVLSGFILAHVYRERFANGRLNASSWADFLRNRFARLYPLHLATMVAMLGVFFIGKRMGVTPHHAEAFTPRSLLANLTLTHAWLPGVATINGPAWSISAEWFAYLFFPLLCAWLPRRSGWRAAGTAAIAFAVMAASRDLTPLAQIALEFPFGVAVYELTARSRRSLGPWAQWAALGVAVLSVCAAGSGLAGPDFAGSPLPGASALLSDSQMRAGVMLAAALGFASLARGGGMLSRLLGWAPVVYGGEISYSIYMCHWIVWTAIHRGLWRTAMFRGAAHGWSILLAFAVTIPMAMAAHHFIELPGRVALRGFRLRRPERKASVAVSSVEVLSVVELREEA